MMIARFAGLPMATAATPDSAALQLNFQDAPLVSVLEYLSEAAGLVIVTDTPLQGRITVISRRPVELDEAVRLINSALKAQRRTALRMGRTLKVVSLADVVKMHIPVRTGNDPEAIEPSDQVITQVVPIRFANAEKLKDNLASLIADNADVTANAETNVLIITDTTANIRRLVEIVRALDTRMSAASEIRVFHLAYSDAENTAELINDIFQQDDDETGPAQAFSAMARFRQMRQPAPGSQQNDSSDKAGLAVKVIASADDRTNSVVVSAPQDLMTVIERVITDLDSNPAQEQSVFVYPLKNANAENLKEVLNNLFGQMAADDATTNQNAAANQNARQRQAVPTPAAAADTAATGDLAGEIFVEADLDTNALLIMTSSKNYEKVKRILDDLDKPVHQVLIKVLLAEVTHDDTLDLGTEFSYLNLWEDGQVQIGTDVGIGALTDGLVANIIDPNFDVKIRALEKKGKLNVLSRPYILTSNNQTAKITVGNEVPFIRDSRITETGQTINTIEYEDIGIILEVTPNINPEGLVIMDVKQEISTLTGNSVPLSDTVNASVFAKRASENRVVVRDGQTVVIGGLIEDQVTETENQVPCLGSIPGLGYLFKRVENKKTKTELLIFLTPTVSDKDEALKAISRREAEQNTMIRNAFPEHIPMEPSLKIEQDINRLNP
jgi:general secretion pathway protein D